MIQTDRLKRLADHLVNGKLGSDVWNFAHRHKLIDGKIHGCAQGELPYVFPQWHFSKKGEIVLQGTNDAYITVGLREFFGFPDDRHITHLFCPNGQEVDIWGGRVLDHKASREDVANNIYEYIQAVAE